MEQKEYCHHIDGRSNLTTLTLSGLSTFTGNVDANGDLDVDGRTELDITNISETLNVTGIATFANNIDANGDLDVDGRTELDITNISETLNVTGIATFASDIDINASIDVDGHTELDDVNVSTALTANNLVVTGSTLLKHSNSLKLQTTGIGVSVSNGVGLTATIAGPSNLIIDPGVVGDNTGVVRIKGDLFVDGTQTQINSTTIELADFIVGVATTATSDLLSDGAGIQIGPNNTFLYEFNGGTNPSLKSSENLNVASGKVYQIDQTEILSATTLGSSVVNSSLTNLGTLTSLTVSGAIDANGNLDVDGRTELDITNISETLNVVGVSTFASNVDLNADLDVDGRTELDTTNISETLNVVGIATFANNIDANGDLDVDGHTELDHVNVSAASTFGGLVDINAGAQVNTLKVEDLTDNRIVLAGTGGEIEDSANLTFDGTTLALTGNQTVSGTIDVDGQAIFDDITVSAASTFTGNIDANGNLDVDGQTDLDVLNVAELATFSANIDANGDLDVDGRTELDITNISDTLNVVGVATFANNIDANGNLDVEGRTELDITNISETLNVTGITTFENNVNVGGALSVTGNSYFVGVVTFAAGTDGNIVLGDAATDNVVFNADVNSNIIPNTNNAYDLGSSSQEWKDLYLNGIAYIDTLQVHEGSTFTGNIDANGNLDVDGHTELDNVNVTGVSTFSDDLTIGSNTVETDINILGSTITYTDVVGGYGTEPTKFYGYNLFGTKNFVISVNHNTSSQQGGLLIRNATDNVAEFNHAPNTYTDFHPTPHCFEVYGGSIQIRNDVESADYLQAPPTLSLWNRVEGNSFTPGDEIHRIDFVAQDASGPGSGTIIRIADVINDTTGADHSLKFFTSDTPNGSPLTTSLSLGPKATELYYLGSKKFETTADGINVLGISTFSGNIDANGNLDVDGHTELDNLNVSGVSTFTGNIDVNGDLDVDGHTELDQLRVSGVSTFQGNVDINDDQRLRFGAGQDLQIFHNSTNNNSVIQETGSGNLVLF